MTRRARFLLNMFAGGPVLRPGHGGTGLRLGAMLLSVGLALGLLLSSGAVQAQTTGGGDNCSGDCAGPDDSQDYGDQDRDPERAPPPPGVPADAVGITPAATQAIVDQVDEANRYCRERYDRRYWIDCIARAYYRIGQALPYRGGYGGMRVALMQAGTQLHQLAIDNTDKAHPDKVGPTGQRTRPELIHSVVATPAVQTKAADIIEGTHLVLLRSSGSETRRVAYEQVANVVGSTVVLLRSGRRKRRKDRKPGSPETQGAPRPSGPWAAASP